MLVVEREERQPEEVRLNADDLLGAEPAKDTKKGKGSYNVDDMANSAPVVKLLNLILGTAIKAQAFALGVPIVSGKFSG